MRNFTDFFENRMEGRELSCVWELIREGKNVHLVARWISAKDKRSEQGEDSNAGAEEQLTEDELSGMGRMARVGWRVVAVVTIL